jgi:hypothetical protein
MLSFRVAKTMFVRRNTSCALAMLSSQNNPSRLATDCPTDPKLRETLRLPGPDRHEEVGLPEEMLGGASEILPGLGCFPYLIRPAKGAF